MVGFKIVENCPIHYIILLTRTYYSPCIVKSFKISSRPISPAFLIIIKHSVLDYASAVYRIHTVLVMKDYMGYLLEIGIQHEFLYFAV